MLPEDIASKDNIKDKAKINALRQKRASDLGQSVKRLSFALEKEPIVDMDQLSQKVGSSSF